MSSTGEDRVKAAVLINHQTSDEDLTNTLEELVTRLEELLVSFTFGHEPAQATTDLLDNRQGEVLEILSFLYQRQASRISLDSILVSSNQIWELERIYFANRTTSLI
jgi:hypothetical protein